MHMRMLGVVVGGGDPLQPCSEIGFHSRQNVSRQLFEIDAFTKFRRDNEFEQSRIASGLPIPENRWNVGNGTAGTKPSCMA